MGLLDSLLGNLSRTGTSAGADNSVIGSVFELLNDSRVGGVEGLVSKMAKGGLEGVVNSWISTGKNKSVKAGQITSILGSDLVQKIASQLGISEGTAAGKIAKYLPVVVDKLTPEGKISPSSKEMSLQDILGSLLR